MNNKKMVQEGIIDPDTINIPGYVPNPPEPEIYYKICYSGDFRKVQKRLSAVLFASAETLQNFLDRSFGKDGEPE